MSVEVVHLPGDSLFLVTELCKYIEALEISKDAIDYTIKGLIKSTQDKDQEGIVAFNKAANGFIPILHNLMVELDACSADPERGGAVLSFVKMKMESEE